MSETLFLRLLPYEDKSAMLSEAIGSMGKGLTLNSIVYVADPASFKQIPGSTFAYWVSERIRHKFIELPQFESQGREVRVGDHPGDGFRYLRLFWEVPADRSALDWRPYQKGGSYSPFYYDIHLVADWDASRQTYRDFYGRPGRSNERPSNYQYFFKQGLTWSRRSQRGLSVRIFPRGCIFADKGPVIFSSRDSLLYLLGLTNSTAFQAFVALQMAFGSYEVGVIQHTPVPNLSGLGSEQISHLTLLCVEIKRDIDRVSETSHLFHYPALLDTNNDTLAARIANWQRRLTKTEQLLIEYQREIDAIAFRLYGIEEEGRQDIEESLKHAKLAKVSEEEESETEDESSEVETSTEPRSLIAALFSYFVGCAYGRWDVRFATHERPMPELPDPFAPLPTCSLGMLIKNDGLPLDDVPSAYPLAINRGAILVDDPDHSDDIVRSTRDVMGVIWKDNGEAIEQEACQLLGVKELRDYFRRPGNDGFWMDHIKRYSKSRRKAPIYWLLQSSKRNYSLWLYYHRLDNDTLFKALAKYVEPKIRLEESHLEQIRTQLASFGTGGREVKQLERQLDHQENLVGELYDFRDKLRRIANLHLEPDLNDGVVLNIAPLWELVPWSEAKKCWDELLAGKYEWSSISKQLRARGVI